MFKMYNIVINKVLMDSKKIHPNEIKDEKILCK